MGSAPEVAKEIVGSDLGPEVHISLQSTDQGNIRVELDYSGADGKGGIWFEENPKAAADRLVKFLPANFQAVGQLIEGVVLSAVPKI